VDELLDAMQRRLPALPVELGGLLAEEPVDVGIASVRRGFPGSGFTSASCIAYMSMNGVTMPRVSAGSNHVGASEMWTPQVI